MQFGAHLVTKQHDTSLIPNDLQMGYPATTILFIDSHEDARQYFVQRLTVSSPDYVVLEADTGPAGLSICKSCRIDCVVLDVDLPDMSGFHVLGALVPRVLRPQIPVIILTGLNIPTLPELALKNGALAYLIKSRTSGDDLDKVIHKALAIVPPTRKEPRP
jgi:DNA-binding NarL/FixJ family response regulator